MGGELVYKTSAKKRREQLFKEPIEMRHLESAILQLRHEVNHTHKNHDKKRVYTHYHCSTSIRERKLSAYRLRARHGNYIADELRKAILQHDWDSAARMLMSLVNIGIKNFNPYIIKTCLLIVFNHPETTPELLTTFLKGCTDYSFDADLDEFIMVMFTLRKQLLNRGTKSNGRSATGDPIFASEEFCSKREPCDADDPAEI